MEDKIEVGEYVKTKNGYIRKIVKEFDKGCYIIDKLYYNKKILESTKGVRLEDIVKHSKNIIDLIEVGDYVNGYKVINVINGEIALSGKCVDIESSMDSSLCTFGEQNIKSIVTKEQFDSMKYIIEEDK